MAADPKTIHLNYGVLWSKFNLLDPGVEGAISLVDNALKLKVPGAHWSPKFGKVWDGYARFISKRGRFASGLLPEVQAILTQKGYSVEVLAPKAPGPPAPVLSLSGVTLRDYQGEAEVAALRGRRGLLKMATNAGKTEVAATIIKALGKQALWLTHSKDLLFQTKERLERRCGVSVTLATAGEVDASGDVVIATVQTLSKYLPPLNSMGARKGTKVKGDDKTREAIRAWLFNIPLVILDECHLGTSNSWLKILMRCSSAEYRFGLSGTPFTGDSIRDRKLVGALGPPLYEMSNKDLISGGYSAKPLVVEIPFTHPKPYNSYENAVRTGVVENPKRNETLSKIASKIEPKSRGLFLVNRVAHGVNIARGLTEHGVNNLFVSGRDTREVREEALKSIKSGQLEVLVSTTIFDLGIDLPELDYLVIAGPSKSAVRTLQRVGRVLRKCAGKETARVYFLTDSGDKFLAEQSESIRVTLAKEGFQNV